MDRNRYSSFGIRPGRIPDLLVGRLLERPRLYRFEDDKEMQAEFRDIKGEFYRVKVDATPPQENLKKMLMLDKFVLSMVFQLWW